MSYPKSLFKKQDGALREWVVQSAQEEKMSREDGYLHLEEIWPPEKKVKQ